MGELSGKCQTLTLSGPIERIRAHYDTDLELVTSVMYFRGGLSKTYGIMKQPYEEWNFDDDSMLLGLHGYEDGDAIKQLGFISVNSDE